MTRLYFLRTATALTYFDANGKAVAMVDPAGPIPELITNGIKRLGIETSLARLNSHAELEELRHKKDQTR